MGGLKIKQKMVRLARGGCSCQSSKPDDKWQRKQQMTAVT
jgi:hypothetical protein